MAQDDYRQEGSGGERHTAGYDHVQPARAYNQANDAGLDPFEIEFRPEFRQDRGPREPFINEYGVLIGDHEYESPQSPLTQWSEETDPAVMSGDQWVHPFKDVGFQSADNRAWFEGGSAPSTGAKFMHADKDAAYRTFEPDDDANNEA